MKYLKNIRKEDGTNLGCMVAQATNITSIITAAPHPPTYKMCVISHPPSRKRHITVRITGLSRTVVSPVWNLLRVV
jgi:hypothetical protein